MSVRSTLAAVVCAAAIALAAGTSAQVPSPAIEGPIASPDGAFIGSPAVIDPAEKVDLSQVGYEQQEYFISGMASAYTSTGPLGDDGIWSVAPGATAAYKTRILVYRPTNPNKFNGTVIVEWLNVSGGVDANPDWTQTHVEIIRQGAAWVGVSAQIVGVEGGPPLLPGLPSSPLKAVNPARYGSLHHPGDGFSYDMFSQAGQAVRAPSGPNPLGDLKPKRVIAVGESQSAFRLVNYVNAIHPIAHVYDGFFIHSRGGIGVPVTPPDIALPGTAAIRADLDVPVLTFETETDLTFLGYLSTRQQEDSQNFRLWEVAGTAHYDTYGLGVGNTDLGNNPNVAALVVTTDPVPGLIHCGTPINSGPQHWVANAGLAALIKWVRTGKAPKSAPRLDASTGPPAAINMDANGNALGGIRTPQVDVPIATFTGEQSGGSIFCLIFGTTTPFGEAKLASLYPTHEAFVAEYNKALKRAVKKGWILEADAKLIKKWAAGSSIGG
jgi:hypothetical protein